MLNEHPRAKWLQLRHTPRTPCPPPDTQPPLHFASISDARLGHSRARLLHLRSNHEVLLCWQPFLYTLRASVRRISACARYLCDLQQRRGPCPSKNAGNVVLLVGCVAPSIHRSSMKSSSTMSCCKSAARNSPAFLALQASLAHAKRVPASRSCACAASARPCGAAGISGTLKNAGTSLRSTLTRLLQAPTRPQPFLAPP
jgi:hypothetical protein